MKTVLKLPGQPATQVTLHRNEDMLPQLQMSIGGYVEVWPTQGLPFIVLCNEEAVPLGLADNLDMSDQDRVLSVPGAGGVLRGPALFVGLTDADGKYTGLDLRALDEALSFAAVRSIEP